jgi:hypothetical protein
MRIFECGARESGVNLVNFEQFTTQSCTGLLLASAAKSGDSDLLLFDVHKIIFNRGFVGEIDEN